jgi:hypothetical protein
MLLKYRYLFLSLLFISSGFLEYTGGQETYHTFGLNPLLFPFILSLSILSTYTIHSLIKKSTLIKNNTSILFIKHSAYFILTTLLVYKVQKAVEFSIGKSYFDSSYASYTSFIFPLLSLLFKQFKPYFINTLSFLGLLFFTLLCIRTLPFYLRTSHYENTTAYPNNKPHIIWVIFDESDYDYIFTMKKEYTLDNINWLRHHSVFATEAFSPARDTVASIPALLTGEILSGVKRTLLGHIKIQLKNHQEWIYYPEKNNFFTRLKADGLSISLLGFHHPYCSQFKHLDFCSAYHLTDYKWPQHLHDYQMLFSYYLRFINPFISSSENNWEYGFTIVTEKLINELSILLDRKDNLSFIHLNLPHAPSIWSKNHWLFMDSGDLKKWLDSEML